MIVGRTVRCDQAGCAEAIPNNRWAKVKAGDEGWFFSFKEGTAWCPQHKPDWVEEWRARKAEKSAADYLELEKRVKAKGEPEEDTLLLKVTADEPEVVCQECGRLEAPGDGWPTDWMALCQLVMRHVRETGHQVAAGLWCGAIYGPER